MGLIFYEMLTGVELPNGGEEWQRLRGGAVVLPENTLDWQRCIRDMIDPDARSRPQVPPNACFVN